MTEYETPASINSTHRSGQGRIAIGDNITYQNQRQESIEQGESIHINGREETFS